MAKPTKIPKVAKAPKVPQDTKNDVSWDYLFTQLPILSQVNKVGFFDITSDEINTIAGRQARLMAKIDFREKLPKIMRANDLAILAIQDGLYRIGRFDPFIAIQPVSTAKAQVVKFPKNIITINPANFTGESEVLDAALLTGILDTVFGEKVQITIRGRSSSYSAFNFTLNKIKFPINGVQIEVDGGYEGNKTVNLVEAKSFGPSNINIRQLLYPQIGWEKEINSKKVVRTYICLYQEPLIRFIPVIFNNGICSADHANELTFIIEPPAKLDIRSITAKPNTVPPNPAAPFPQANRLDTALAMFTVAARASSSGAAFKKEDLVADFDVEPDVRHVDYYFNVLNWLGLVTSKSGFVFITPRGLSFASMSHADKMDTLAETIFSEPIFNHILHNGPANVPSSLFKRWRIGTSTESRRISTVVAWIKFFDDYVKQTKI